MSSRRGDRGREVRGVVIVVTTVWVGSEGWMCNEVRRGCAGDGGGSL